MTPNNLLTDSPIFLKNIINCKYGPKVSLGTIFNPIGEGHLLSFSIVLLRINRVIIIKISFILFARCVYAYCLTFHIYLNTISYQVAADQITWARKGHNLLFVHFTFLCYFLKEKTSEEGESRKASGKQIITLLMINSQNIV